MPQKKTNKMTRLKLVAVGDYGTGRTSLLIVGAKKECPINYIPQSFDCFVMDFCVDRRDYEVAFWDPTGGEDYDLLRTLEYPNTDVLLLLFSIEDRESFKSITDKWIIELKHFCPNAPIVLVGTKSDLRDNPKFLRFAQFSNEKLITYGEGVMLAKKIGAVKYVECSALNNQGVDYVFEQAIRATG